MKTRAVRLDCDTHILCAGSLKSKIIKLAMLAFFALCLSNCGSIIMHMMGARGKAVPFEQVSSLYYKTSPDLKKAYLFYSIPGRIPTGMATSYGSVGGIRAITIDFGAVKDTPGHRKEFGSGIYSNPKVGDEWVAEFDIGENDPGKPHDQQIKIYYGIERRDRDEPVPYRGIWRRNRKATEQASQDNNQQRH